MATGAKALVVQEPLETTVSSRRKLVIVDAHDDGLVGLVAGGGDQHPPGAGLQMSRRLVARGEDAGALEGDVDAKLLVRQLGGIADGGGACIRPKPTSIQSSPWVTSPGNRRWVLSYFNRCALVATGPRSLTATTSMSARAVLGDGAQDEAADAAEAVDGDADRPWTDGAPVWLVSGLIAASALGGQGFAGEVSGRVKAKGPGMRL